MAPLKFKQKNQDDEVSFIYKYPNNIINTKKASDIDSKSKTENKSKITPNPSPSDKDNDQDFIDFKLERKKILEQVSNELPQIIRKMERANRSLNHKEGNETKELRSLWRC